MKVVRIEFPIASEEDFEAMKEASKLPCETWTLIDEVRD